MSQKLAEMPLPSDAPPAPSDRRAFWLRLGLIALGALILRALYVLLIAPMPARMLNDTFWYAFVSNQIAGGHGFSFLTGNALAAGLHLEPTAQHPPLYPLALAGLRDLGVTSLKGLLWLGVVTGTVTVVGLGVLGRTLAGPRVGLVAAGLGACYPLLIVADGALLSETLYGPVLILIIGSALACVRRPSVQWSAALGLCIGVATLVRSEALALVVLLALPLAWRGHGGTARMARLLITVACAVAVIAPWVIRNENALGSATLSTNEGVTLAWANCRSTYYGSEIGYIDSTCSPHGVSGNEAHFAAVARRQGLRYASHHLGRLPIVIAVRLARTWGLFRPFAGSHVQGRNVTVSKIGVVMYYPLVILAVIGAGFLRRRRMELWVLLAPIVLVCLVVATSFGSLRLRYLAELPLVLLAAIGIATIRQRRAPTAPAPG